MEIHIIALSILISFIASAAFYAGYSGFGSKEHHRNPVNIRLANMWSVGLIVLGWFVISKLDNTEYHSPAQIVALLSVIFFWCLVIFLPKMADDSIAKDIEKAKV